MKISSFGVLAVTCMALSSLAVHLGFSPNKAEAKPPHVATAPQPKSARSPSVTQTPTLSALLGFGAQSSFEAGTTVKMNARLGHATLASGQTGSTFVHVDLSAATNLESQQSAPLNLAIVLDRSRSMAGKRMENALAAARGTISGLRDGDTVSVVVYNTRSTILLPPTQMDARTRGDAVLALRGIEARGNTCISCGLEDAMELLSRRSGSINRILLLSDGEANAGIRGADGFRILAERARAMETSVSAIGVDVDYNESVMVALANGSNGRHYFVENAASLPRIFEQESRSLLDTIATGAEVAIALAPGVELVKMFDRSFTRRNGQIIVPLGNFAQGDRKSVLMQIRTPAVRAGRLEVADLRLRFRDLVADQARDCEGELVAAVSDDRNKIAPLDAVVETRLVRAQTLKALTNANALFASGELEAAAGALTAARGTIKRRRLRTRVQSSPEKRDIERQIAALDQASTDFEDAAAAEPGPAAPTSRRGKSSIRRNAANFDKLAL